MTWFFKRKTFKNPILPQGADPHVTYYNGQYILIKSEEKDSRSRIVVRRAKNLTSLAAAPIETIWSVPQGRIMHNIWAPELHLLNDKWYIYFAADDGKNENHRMFVLESDFSEPTGPYHEMGQITDSSNKWAIDGTVLVKANHLYFIWSGWPSDENVQQDIYIAPMIDPWTLGPSRVIISKPEFVWEIPSSGPSVNEGPQILYQNGKTYLIYSANGSWTDDYCLGLLELAGEDPLTPSSWIKCSSPIFHKDPLTSVYGPGHCSFIKSLNGEEDWIVYHANTMPGSSWSGRSIRTQRFEWHNDGSPNLGSPVPIHIPLTKPAGE